MVTGMGACCGTHVPWIITIIIGNILLIKTNVPTFPKVNKTVNTKIILQFYF